MRNILHLGTILLAVVASVNTGIAKDAHFKVLYSFCSLTDCRDGRVPTGLVTRDAQGNFYVATTEIDGSGYQGTVVELSPGDKHYKAKILHTFNDFPNQPPNSGVIMDVNGNLYGTTGDVVYELMPNANHKKWKYKVLYTYCPDGNCQGGDQPSGDLTYAGAASGLPYDGMSPLYGTARFGGVGEGVVYQLAPNGDGWDESIVYSFCQKANCADGSEPRGGVYAAGDGSLYGVTAFGGNIVGDCVSGCGLVFHLTPPAPHGQRGTQWKDETLYAFCSLTDCADGKEPFWHPTLDAEGNILGAISNVVYKLSKKGKHWTFTSLHGVHGSVSPVTLDSAGAIYGEDDAFPGQGSVYRLSGGDFTTLHTFCLKDSCKDGGQPRGGLLLDESGDVFGINASGAKFGGSGVLFEITP